MKILIPNYSDFLKEDAATMTDSMQNLLQDVNRAAQKRIKTIDRDMVAKGMTVPGKKDSVINISIQNHSYPNTGIYSVSDLKKGVNIEQKDWNRWTDAQITKHIQQWLNNIKKGQE